jgi:hypothetical protein
LLLLMMMMTIMIKRCKSQEKRPPRAHFSYSAFVLTGSRSCLYISESYL